MSVNLRRAFVIGLAISLVATPQVAMASDTDQGRADGGRDGKSDAKGIVLLGSTCCLSALAVGGGGFLLSDAEGSPLGVIGAGVGCLVGLLVVGAAYMNVAPPPAWRLTGRSPEYSAAYLSSYERSLRTAQATKAAIGWGIGGAAGALLVTWYIVALMSTS